MTNTLRDLGDGLHLKRATLDDVERLADYNARNLSDGGPDHPEEVLENWTRDLITNHPTATPSDFTYVEDTRANQIVSSLCLISQTWAYKDIPFSVGRVEMVSTHRDYRRRGLIRAQFEAIHRLSLDKGEVMQAITGIPYFYRQFGYEMTLSLGGFRRGYRPHVPDLKSDEAEPYQIRLAVPEDIPFLSAMYDHGRKRCLISCLRGEKTWRYEMMEQHETFRGDMAVIETPGGEPVGFIWHTKNLSGSGGITLFLYELKPGVSWNNTTPTVIRHLKARGQEYAKAKDEKEWESFSFDLGSHHPAYDVAARYLPEKNPPYTWYIRVPDLPGFIQHISPVLNRRLGESEYAGYSGELLLDFYVSGVKLTLENGILTAAQNWQPSTENRGDLAFPDHTFLHLLCGHRSFEELETFRPDCYRRNKPEAPALINVLFPKANSHILGIV